MIVAGIDIGSRAAKAVVMNDGTIVSSVICDTGPESVKTSKMTMTRALERTGLDMDDLEYVVATGYGRVLVPFANENISEIILDMGGQDCKAINCDADGRVTNFVMNDKCAGGTGRFLEMIAEVLKIPLEDIGEAALRSEQAIPFNTICAVFAKSEAIASIATRCLNLIKRVSVEKEFAITGGIAKNRGMVAQLREKVGLEPLLSEDPQLIGALGAALFAEERSQGKTATVEAKMQYGYADGTGNYFITIDTARCDGCGKCVPACPYAVFEVVADEGEQLKARVKEEARKKLAMLCPGHEACLSKLELNCQKTCPREAISHTW